MSKARSSLVGLTVLGLVALGACGSDDNDNSAATNAPAGTTAPAAGGTTAGAAVTGSIDAADQTSDGKTMTVAAVNITGASGFIAVHSDANGAPGPVVGHVAIPQGDSSNVSIPMDSTIPTGDYWPMLHLDAGTVGTYEFPGPDGPVKSGSDIVMKKITVTVG